MATSLTTAQIATLRTELLGDPEALGYAAQIAAVNINALITLLEATRDGVTPTLGVIGGPSGTITGATNATPIVITTSAPHGLNTGDGVLIAGVGGNTAANGTFNVTKVSSTTFSLNSSAGNGAYTSGGTFQWCVAGIRQQFVSAQSLLNSVAFGDLITNSLSATVTADQYGKLWLLEQIILAAQSNGGQIPLTNSDGSDNNNVKTLKQIVANPSGSRTAIIGLETRNGSRLEQILGVSGVTCNQDDVDAALQR